MNLFALNLLVALVWSLVTGQLSATSLGTGFAVGFGVLWLLEPVHGDRQYHRRPWRLATFIGWYLLELLLSSVRVAVAVLSPIDHLRDGWVTVTLQSRRDTDIALLANLISLTPGTLSVDVADDKRFLYVHALLRRGDDVDELERELSTTLPWRLRAVLGRGEKRPGSSTPASQPWWPSCWLPASCWSATGRCGGPRPSIGC